MSSDPFATLISDSRAFLNALADNNTKDWFNDNKPTYEAQLRAPALALLDTMAASLEKQSGQVPSTKLFRPHRDVRFSKDKTPYHLHLHMLWSTPPVGYFFGIGRDYLSVGGGIMGFDKDHPQAASLKRKSCTVWFDFEESDITKGGLVSKLETAFKKLQPLTQLLAAL